MDARREGEEDVRKPGVLVIHNRYRQPGGEDTVVRAEVALLRQHGHRVTEYVRDNTEIETFHPLSTAALMLSTTWNPQTYSEIRQLVRAECTAITCCR